MDKIFDNWTRQLSMHLSRKRLTHSIGVSQTAAKLAVRYGACPYQAASAGLLHDCARELSSNTLLQLAEGFGILISDVEAVTPSLLHAPVGACLAQRDYGVTDEDILSAIRWHTTGKRDMTLLEKIIFLADYIEPHRDYPGVGILRELAWRDLDKAVLKGYNQTIQYILNQEGLIHGASVEGRNDLLMKLKH